MKSIKFVIFILAFALIVNAQSRHSEEREWARLVPDSTDGWLFRPSEGQTYNRQTLYEFIDGGAEAYLSYGFRQLFHRLYARPENPDILLDIYDMGDCENAYGIFLQQAVDSNVAFGQGAYYAKGYLLFWKGRFLVNILALQETPQSKRAVFRLARQIDSRIRQHCPLPSLPDKLPRKGRIKQSLRYFHSYFWLQRAFNLPDKNIFQISDSVKIAMARYDDGTVLALIAYPGIKQAQTVLQTLRQRYFTKVNSDGIFLGQRKGLLLKRKNNILIFAQNTRHPEVIKRYVNLKFKEEK